MFGRRWYIEVLIIAVIVPIIGIGITWFIPFPLSFLVYTILFIVVIIWRIRKRALTVKEAIVLVLILYGVSKPLGLLLPDPLSYAVSIPFIFLIVWLIHKKTTASIHA